MAHDMGTKVCKRMEIRRLEHLNELKAITHDAEAKGAAIEIQAAVRGGLSRRLLDVENNLTWSQDSSLQFPESMFEKPRRDTSPAGIWRLVNRRRLEERHIRPAKSHPAWAASLSAGGVRPTLDIYVG
jgi:hypothetical protein